MVPLVGLLAPVAPCYVLVLTDQHPGHRVWCSVPRSQVLLRWQSLSEGGLACVLGRASGSPPRPDRWAVEAASPFCPAPPTWVASLVACLASFSREAQSCHRPPKGPPRRLCPALSRSGGPGHLLFLCPQEAAARPAGRPSWTRFPACVAPAGSSARACRGRGAAGSKAGSS